MTELAAREAAALMHTYQRLPVAFVRGDGTRLFDVAGKSYLDCLSGIAVTSVGHANPRVAEAVNRQMSALVHVSNLFYTAPQVDLAEQLCRLSGLDRVFFSNDGATANEAAIKLARRWGQAQRGPECFEVITLDGSFHGRTLATLAATGQPAKQARFIPLPTGFLQIPPNDLPAVAAAIHGGTAAVMIETTQGEGGVLPLVEEYLTDLRSLCDDRRVLLIVDDVQAGVGRTGTWFSWQSLGFAPDIATAAKALANGLPIGACLATKQVAAAFQPGDHATTFGGGPVICAAALATLAEIEETKLLDNVVARGEQLRLLLERVAGVAQVRGRGLLIAAVLQEPIAEEVVSAALGEGLVINNVLPDVVRFTPPLTISAEEVAEAVRRFEKAVARATPEGPTA
ncbi:MAG: aspartate aminotransferase family protein [Acidimicrobiia bacterium]|nr:aspartate aminotransferase family protein [Acidimicrobiia bacterium]